MKKKKSIFSRIKSFLSNIFGKNQEIKMLPSSPKEDIIKEIKEEIFTDNKEDTIGDNKMRQLYKNVRAKKVKLEEVSYKELIELKKVMEQEVDIKKKSIDEAKNKNRILKQEIVALMKKLKST